MAGSGRNLAGHAMPQLATSPFLAASAWNANSASIARVAARAGPAGRRRQWGRAAVWHSGFLHTVSTWAAIMRHRNHRLQAVPVRCPALSLCLPACPKCPICMQGTLRGRPGLSLRGTAQAPGGAAPAALRPRTGHARPLARARRAGPRPREPRRGQARPSQPASCMQAEAEAMGVRSLDPRPLAAGAALTWPKKLGCSSG